MSGAWAAPALRQTGATIITTLSATQGVAKIRSADSHRSVCKLSVQLVARSEVATIQAPEAEEGDVLWMRIW